MEAGGDIKINASDTRVDFLVNEFELKRDIALKYLVESKGNLEVAIDLVTDSEKINETKFA